MAKSYAEMKFVNQNLTDERLNIWLSEHQNVVYRLLTRPNFEDLKKAVYSAMIIYKYYFRLLITSDEEKLKFDEKFKELYTKLKVKIKEARQNLDEIVSFDEDLIYDIIDLMSELSSVLQKAKYFYNIYIPAKDFETALNNLENLKGGR